ncbi:6560_t:CDS:2, partial [Paraglomus brasilianum]
QDDGKLPPDPIERFQQCQIIKNLACWMEQVIADFIIPFSQSTISDILSNEEKWALNRYSFTRKKLVKLSPTLEEALSR